MASFFEAIWDAILDVVYPTFVPLVLILIALGIYAAVALVGFLFVVVGHIILRASSLRGYDYDILETMKFSSFAAVLIGIPIAFLLRYLTPSGSDGCSAACKCFNQLLVSTLYGALTGVIGSAIWHRAGHGGLPVWAAARAGCVGAVVLGPFFVFLSIFVLVIWPRLRNGPSAR